MVGTPWESVLKLNAGLLMVSRLQFARPAVVCSFLDQIIWTPPVEAESCAIRPDVILESSSARKSEAMVCLAAAKAFLESLSMRGAFAGIGFLKREVPPDIEGGWSLGLEIGWRVFMGEYWSFQSLTRSCDQKLSMLGRCGVDGMRDSFLGDVSLRGLSSGLPGGVESRTSLDTFLGDGELIFISIFLSQWDMFAYNRKIAPLSSKLEDVPGRFSAFSVLFGGFNSGGFISGGVSLSLIEVLSRSWRRISSSVSVPLDSSTTVLRPLTNFRVDFGGVLNTSESSSSSTIKSDKSSESSSSPSSSSSDSGILSFRVGGFRASSKLGILGCGAIAFRFGSSFNTFNTGTAEFKADALLGSILDLSLFVPNGFKSGFSEFCFNIRFLAFGFEF